MLRITVMLHDPVMTKLYLLDRWPHICSYNSLVQRIVHVSHVTLRCPVAAAARQVQIITT